MIGLVYEEIVEKIKQHAHLSDQEIQLRVKQKIDTLSGLVSREGALHILANELGLDLLKDIKKNGLKIERVAVGMRNVTVCGRVLQVYGIREYAKEGRTGKVGTFLIGDETGVMRIVVWETGLQTLMEDGRVADGVIVRVGNGYIKENNGYKEMHLGGMSELVVNPPGVEVGAVTQLRQSPSFERCSLADLQDGMSVSISGTIVQVFTPRFYDGCPQCGRKITNGCETHGAVVGVPLGLLNFILDDGTGNVRVVVFRDDVKALTGLDDGALKALVDSGEFDQKQGDLLGKQISLNGRARVNQMSGGLEFSGRGVAFVQPQQLVEEALKP